MTLANARALLPVDSRYKNNNINRDGVGGNVGGNVTLLIVGRRDPLYEETALQALAEWAMKRFTPRVALDPPDGLLLDITGCQRLFGGERALIARLTSAVRAMGIEARAAVAPTFGCACALARFGDGCTDMDDEEEGGAVIVADRCDISTVLAPLPIRALRVDHDIEEAMDEIGIQCIGHLMNLPRASLPARFGDDLLAQLDQALGRCVETIEPIRWRNEPCVSRTFAGPVVQYEAVERSARELLAALIVELQHRESGASRFEMKLARVHDHPAHITITLSRPSRSETHLWSLLGPKLAVTNLGDGIEEITFAASELHRLAHEQLESPGWVRIYDSDAAIADGLVLEPGISPGKLAAEQARLIDTIIARLGPQRVLHVQTPANHLPEQAVAYRSAAVTPMTVSTTWTAASARQSKKLQQQMAGATRSLSSSSSPMEHDGTQAPADRPSILLTPPEPVEVIAQRMPDRTPTLIRRRGRRYHVVHGFGPERIASPWWRCDITPAALETHISRDCPSSPAPPFQSFTRDYYRIQDDCGRWLWLYRELETNQWYIHGEWA